MDNLDYNQTVLKHGWPMCAKCNKHVEELANGPRLNFGDAPTLIAHCHGEYEILEVAESIIRDIASPYEIRLDGVAFAGSMQLSP